MWGNQRPRYRQPYIGYIRWPQPLPEIVLEGHSTLNQTRIWLQYWRFCTGWGRVRGQFSVNLQQLRSSWLNQEDLNEITTFAGRQDADLVHLIDNKREIWRNFEEELTTYT